MIFLKLGQILGKLDFIKINVTFQFKHDFWWYKYILESKRNIFGVELRMKRRIRWVCMVECAIGCYWAQFVIQA